MQTRRSKASKRNEASTEITHLHVDKEDGGFEESGGVKPRGYRKSWGPRDPDLSRRHRLIRRAVRSGKGRNPGIQPSVSPGRILLPATATGAAALEPQLQWWWTAVSYPAANISGCRLRNPHHF
ncbi:hypothetical protein BHM03_00029447 [Ensete ventricosum]|nr:hypothetical protein BHM03_00029447 [Ensete ventricosum]